jgi:hypothetical protein
LCLILRLNQDFSTFAPRDDPFNIDEIEQRNEERLRELEDSHYRRKKSKKRGDVIADFLNSVRELCNTFILGSRRL